MEKKILASKVVKSNALVGASYRLSVQEQRVILVAISQVISDSEITDEIMYSVRAEDFIQITGQSLKHAYQELKDASLRLMRRELRIDFEPNGLGKKKKTLLTRWVQTISYVESEGKIELRFGKDILPYLCQLQEQFTIYNLKNVAKMNSSYGIRLYELLAQWKNTGRLETSVDWLRESFQVKDKYQNIRDFKRRVIDPALKDVNEVSDLWAKFEQKKSGKRVTHFTFTFGLKRSEKLPKKRKPKVRLSDIFDDTFLSRHALPGESKDQAIRRLRKLHNV